MQRNETAGNRAAVLTAPREIRIDDRPIPTPAANEVLVRVEAVGVCGSDVHYFRHGRVGRYVVEAPMVLGHESAGTIIAAGVDVDQSRIGERVAIEPGVPCGTCALCRAGVYNLCVDVVFHATPPVDGTLQQYVVIRSDYAFTLPASVSTEQGALVEPLAVAVWACRKAGVAPGKTVLVTGCGPVGILAMQTARAFGASRVVVTDVDPAKLELARELGADLAVDAADLAEVASGFDVHIECSGSIVAAKDGISRLGPRGVAVLVGMGSSAGLDIPVSWIQEKELSVTGVFRYANCFPLAIELLAGGKIGTDKLISGRFTLDDSAQAIEAAGGNGVFKALIFPNTSAQQ